MRDDYLDAGFLQLLIDAGVSLGFHGHQHLPECFDERYTIGPRPRKNNHREWSTLCAEPRNLTPGVARSYNVVELDTDAGLVACISGRWSIGCSIFRYGALGIFTAQTRRSLTSLCASLYGSDPLILTNSSALERADKLLGAGQWHEALDVLIQLRGFLPRVLCSKRA